MATTTCTERRPSTEDICREAAERLNNIQIRSFRDENEMPLEEFPNNQPPPYSEIPLGFLPVKRELDSTQSFLVPPPPPPSPGDALKDNATVHQHYQQQEQSSPIPSAPPASLMCPPRGQDNLTPLSAYYAGVSPNHLPVIPVVSHGISPGPSPIHNHTILPTPTCVTVQPQTQIPSQMQTQYPPPSQALATSTPVMVQPPPPPPPPPPLPVMAQYNTQTTTNNQNINTNTNQNVNNVNVNVETGGNYSKKRRYPNYLCFSVILCLFCWVLNPAVYICIIPALICSCYSCSANTYRKSRFGGKWAFSCDLIALVCGLVSFVLLILPFVIVFSLAGSGVVALGNLFKEHFDNYTKSVLNEGSMSSTLNLGNGVDSGFPPRS